ncbi:MAG: FkbH-like protein [Oleiphilaceae bacterium]|jgi:FkbH-like protein
MTNNQKTINHFESILPRKPGWVVVHSSIVNLNIDTDNFKWEILRLIKKYVDKGYTFAFTSFTFSFCSNGYFDHYKSKSETGILADWVLDLYDAIRTKHPIYSHVIIGKDAPKAQDASSVSCFGNQSIYNFFKQQNATICMFGCSWDYCTPFHYFEEQFKVPYRYHKDFISKHDPQLKATMYVRDLQSNPTNNFMPAVEKLNKQGNINVADIDSNLIQSTTFKALAAVCNKHLSDDLYCYVSNSKKVKSIITEVAESDSCEIIKVAILANNNFEPLKSIFKVTFAELCSMRRLEFWQNSYDQMLSDVYSGKVQDFNPDYCFLPSRLEDVYKVSELEFANISNHRPLNDYINLIKKINHQVNRKAFIHLFPVITQSSNGSVLIETDLCLYKFIQKANIRLIEETKDLKQIKLLAPEMMSTEQLIFDPRQWYLGRIPYPVNLLQNFSSQYCGFILNDIGKTTRLLVLDLDNTLWGGVLGEDGVNGISLGGDFPGNSFKDFQKTIIALKDRGVALAIVSKNDERIALSCIEEHQDMLIKKNDIAAYQINWREKYINIKKIADELGLALSNILFIDDNPVEREKIKINLPEVKVIELPNDPALYRQALLNSPYLLTSEITDEDKKRSKSYTKKRVFNQNKSDYENIEDFLTSLNIELKINKLNNYNFPRVLQLINKTNQFNATTKRYTEINLKKMLHDDNYFVGVVAYKDQMTEFEKIGVFILEKKKDFYYIDTLLLSCRVLGRSLEDAIIAWIVNHAREQGIDCLYGEIIETPRNTPVREIYKKLGFVQKENGQWCFQTSNIINTPNFIKMQEIKL